MKKYSIICFALLASWQLRAQDMLTGLARPGAKGIFVLTGEVITDAKGPITGYRIERKEAGETSYREIATLPAVPTLAEFKRRALASGGMLPYQQDIGALRLDSIWYKGKATGTLARLKTIGFSTPVLAGFNMIWLDEKVKAGKNYQYRVTAIGGTYTALSLPVRFAPLAVATPLYQNAVYNKPQKFMQLLWRTPFKGKPDHLEVWRKEENGTFGKIPAITGMLPGKDSVQYLVKDTSAIAGRLYRYFLQAYDVLGNAAPLSDTITIASLDPLQMPLPRQVKTTSDSATRSIKIAWQLPEAPFVKMLTLYRSTNSVTNFERVAELAATDTLFFDQQVQPATPYFYYFGVEYKTQDRPKRSTAFAASFIDALPPARPRNLTATGNRHGVALHWDHHSAHTAGFWLYRAERGQPLQLLATLIPAIDSVRQYIWTDTDSLLKGDRFYQYVLRSYSTSHVESPFSDTVVARPLKNIPVPRPPMQVTAYAEDGRVYVSWDAVSNYDASVAGYKLLRSSRSPGARDYVTDTILRSSNLYADTLVSPGHSYRYSVITQSVWEVESVPAAWAMVTIAGEKPAAPASLTANRVAKGIRLDWEPPAANTTLRYNIYRYERGRPPVKAGTVAGHTGQFTDTGAAPGKHYFYFICSLSPANEESDRSNEAGILF